MFISCFGKGDFLSLHADIDFTDYAFVVFFTRKWDASYRGILTCIWTAKKRPQFWAFFKVKFFRRGVVRSDPGFLPVAPFEAAVQCSIKCLNAGQQCNNVNLP